MILGVEEWIQLCYLAAVHGGMVQKSYLAAKLIDHNKSLN